MHGARLMGYPVYYMSRAPAAPDIGTQHLEIPESIIPVDAWDERLHDTVDHGNRESTRMGIREDARCTCSP